MARLTCGERVVRCLAGEPIDRVPYGVGLGWRPWGTAMARWRRESGNPGLDLNQEFGFDPAFANPAVHYGLFPRFEPLVLEETQEFVISRDYRGITMRNRRDRGSMPEFLDYPVKTAADWERLKAERLRPDEPGRIAEDWEAFRARLRRTGEAVQFGQFPYGVFGTPRDLLGAEELLRSFYTQPQLVQNMMDHLTGLWISLLERVAAEVQVDHLHIWEDMSGRQGSLISPQMVERFMLPCYERLVACARALGVRLISVDTDGNCEQLVAQMTAQGVNVFFPFEVQAGNDVLAYRRRYPTLGILGGLDKRALAGSQADVDGEVDRAAEMVRHGRYVPGFDHLIPPDVPWERYRYAAGELRRVCYGR